MLFISKTSERILRFKIQILWIIATSLIVYFLYFVIQHAVTPSNGFASYYTASRLLIEGEDAVNFYNDDYFSSKVEEYVPGIYEIYLVNLPTTALLVLPFAGLDYTTARIFWITFNLLLLAVSVVFIARRMKFNQAWLPFILILILWLYYRFVSKRFQLSPIGKVQTIFVFITTAFIILTLVGIFFRGVDMKLDFPWNV